MIKFDARGAWRFIARRGTACLTGALLVGMLTACGGGGGSAGAPVLPGNGSGSSTTGSGPGTGGATAAYAIVVDVQRSGTSTTQITSVETVQAVATVTTSSGTPVPGVVVAFTEGSVGLLAFQPQAATALTDANGKASVDLGAKANTSTGATTVTATASVAGVSVTANKSIAIAAGSTSTTTPTPATISFVSSSAGSQAIAVKGAGGNGRAEAAILVFKVLDSVGAPINGASVDFTLNPGGAVGTTISPANAVSDSGGRVTTTVLSGSTPGSVVVIAASHIAPTVKVQSDTLLVSNSVPTASGFELVAVKYNLDGNFTGDSTTLTAFVRDAFGNPVSDGVAVSFQTDYGVVASSTQGGCTTVNGTCNVTFRVQNPRGDGLATVVGTVDVGTSTVLQQSLSINMASAAYTVVQSNSSSLLTSVQLTGNCKMTFQARLQDSQGRSVAAGTKITADLVSTEMAVAIKSGSSVADQLGSFSPVGFGFEVDATSNKLLPPCNPNGTIPALPQGFVNLTFTTPNGVIAGTQRIDIYYPQ